MWDLLLMLFDLALRVGGLVLGLFVLYGVMSWAAVGIGRHRDLRAQRRERAERAAAAAAPWEPYIDPDPSYVRIGVRERAGATANRRSAELASISVHAADVREQIRAAWEGAQGTAALLNDPLGAGGVMTEAEAIVANWSPPVGRVLPPAPGASSADVL